MSRIFLFVKQRYALSDEEAWLLSGMDRTIGRSGTVICDRAKEANIFGTGQALVDYKNRDNILTALVRQGLATHNKTHTSNLTYGIHNTAYHAHNDTYTLSKKFEESLPLFCPQGRT